jgi:hypothetical protein
MSHTEFARPKTSISRGEDNKMAGDPCGSPAIVQPQRLTSSRGNLPE